MFFAGAGLQVQVMESTYPRYRNQLREFRHRQPQLFERQTDWAAACRACDQASALFRAWLANS